ncbi:MAG: SGNH/GDSL hydrolase family protein [Candidatus Brocadiales bacterium]
MNKYLNRENILRAILILFGSFTALAVGEIGLRILYPCQNKYYVWPPNLRRDLDPVPDWIPGVRGKARFYINSQGIRADEFSDDQQYRIIAIGGSTTECVYLDQTEAWPYVLQEKLNSLAVCNVWVGNVGKSAANTRDHILQMNYMLPQYHNIDAVIFLVGINDFMHRLRQGVSYNHNFLNKPDWEQRQMGHTFSIFPATSFYERMAIWHFARQVKPLYLGWLKDLIQDKNGRYVVKNRQRRKNASKILDKMPDLTSALEEYGSNLIKLIDIAKANSVRLIFMTQPSIWRQDLTPQEEGLLWLATFPEKKGGRGMYYTYTKEALNEGMKKYNNTLVEVCKLRGIECIDLASRVPKNTAAFYDDAHFNENGSRIVADTIYKYLSGKEPFTKSIAMRPDIFE